MDITQLRLRYFQKTLNYMGLLEPNTKFHFASLGNDTEALAGIVLAMIMAKRREEKLSASFGFTTLPQDRMQDCLVDESYGTHKIGFFKTTSPNVYSEFSDIKNKSRGWKVVDGIPRAFNSVGKYIVCRNSREDKNYLVFYPTESDKALKNVVTALPSVFPTLFEKNPLEDYERDILKYLSTDIEKCVDIIVEKFEEVFKPLERLFIEEAVKDMFHGSLERRIRDAENGVQSMSRDVQYFINEISRLNSEIDALNENIFALKYKLSEEDVNTDLIDFLHNNKSVINVSPAVINGSQGISFTVDTEVSYYDEEALRIILSNNRHDIGHIQKRFLTETLLNKKASIMVTSNLGISESKLVVISRRSTVRKNGELVSFPNPHISTFSCFGGNAPQIQEAIVNKDYIAAIQIASASVANINFLDSTVMNSFFESIHSMYYNDVKVVKYEDGTMATIKEFFERLDNEEN